MNALLLGNCAAKVCAAANYKSCKTVTTHKCISKMGIKQIMSAKVIQESQDNKHHCKHYEKCPLTFKISLLNADNFIFQNIGMCPFVLHEKCSYGGDRYPLLPDEKKNWGKKTKYTSLKFSKYQDDLVT